MEKEVTSTFINETPPAHQIDYSQPGNDQVIFSAETDGSYQEILQLASEVVSYWEGKRYTPKKDGFPLLSCPTSLLVVNSTIAPYIDLIKPDQEVNAHDVLIQKCIRLNSLEKSGLLSSDEWTTSFLMGGIVTTQASLPQVIDDVYGFFRNEQGIQKDELIVTFNPNDAKSVDALQLTNIPQQQLRTLTSNGDVWVSWQFGKPGPFGEGITFSLKSPHSENEADQFLNVIHIDSYVDSDGNVHHLPNSVIDVGFGLERFLNLRNGVKPFDSQMYAKEVSLLERKVASLDHETSIKIGTIADNKRTLSYLLAEGILPDKKSAGYLSRKLARNIFLQLDSLGLLSDSEVYQKLFSIDERNILETELVAYEKMVDKAESIIRKLNKNKYASQDEIIRYLKDTHGIPEEISVVYLVNN